MLPKRSENSVDFSAGRSEYTRIQLKLLKTLSRKGLPNLPYIISSRGSKYNRDVFFLKKDAEEHINPYLLRVMYTPSPDINDLENYRAKMKLCEAKLETVIKELLDSGKELPNIEVQFVDPSCKLQLSENEF